MASNNDNLLEQLIEAENSHDLERMLALMTDDVVIEDVPFGIVMRGKDGVKKGFSGFFAAASDFKVEPKSWVTTDKSFALEVIFTGT
jgi:ketosteroid isomerase-like protein